VADGVQKKCLLYLVLAHDCGEWKYGFFPVQLVPSSVMTPCETEHIGARAFLYLHKLFDPTPAVSFSRTVFAALDRAARVVRRSFGIEGKRVRSEKYGLAWLCCGPPYPVLEYRKPVFGTGSR
jgi:hypothetical protein